MKKFEIYGKDFKRAYRRHCARKKLKQRAKLWEGHFRFNCGMKSWGEAWEEIQRGDYGRWMDTTGTPCSCESCSWPHFKRKHRSIIQEEIYNTIFELNETDGLTLEINFPEEVQATSKGARRI